MKLFEVHPIHAEHEDLLETPFTPKNFPGDINKGYSGAGERTDYINSPHNNEGGGFKLHKAVDVVQPVPGYEHLKAGTQVHIIIPGTLYRGVQIGAPKRNANGVFTQVGINSADAADAIGYVPISSITKPAGAKQGRVALGDSAQNQVLQRLYQEYGQDHVQVLGKAPVGSTKPDLLVSVDGKRHQFEIKGTASWTAPITFFDKSFRRGLRIPLLDDLAAAVTNGEYHSFEKLVDKYRAEDHTIGFAGDEGVLKSGKLPRAFKSTDPAMMDHVRRVIIDHLKKGGDDYFVVYNRAKDDVKIYPVDKIPRFKSANLATYGGPSAGATRIGLKIQLEQ